MEVLSLRCHLGHGGKQFPSFSFCLPYPHEPHVNPACIMSPELAYVQLHNQDHAHLPYNSSGVQGELGSLGCLLSGSTPGSAPYRPFPLLGGPRSQLSMASFHRVSGGQRPLTGLPPPRGRIQGYHGELGNRPWLSDRGCPACPRTELALIPPCHERADCSVAEHERIERRPSTAPSLEHRPRLIVQGLCSAEERVNEDPVWVNGQTLASQRG